MKIVITGATSGIGKQLALDYRAEGHDVWAVGRSQEVLAELEMLGIRSCSVDLGDRQATLNFFADFEDVDLVILSAGTCEYIDIPHFDSELVSRILRANVEGVAHSIEALLPALRRGGGGHLVGIGSSASYLPLPRAEAYGASKAAVAYLLKTLQITLKSEGVDVSLVCPGFVRTPLTDRNDFPMPFLVEVETASRIIRSGIRKRKREIHFPAAFTWPMKLMSLLPQTLWARVAKRMVRS